MIDLVVTRHPGLVTYLQEEGFACTNTKVLAHANPTDVQGKHVCGVLPHSLSCLTASFTEVPLSLPAELRGKELSLEQVREYAGPVVTYVVLRPETVGDGHLGRLSLVTAARKHYGRPCQCGSGHYWNECLSGDPCCG